MQNGEESGKKKKLKKKININFIFVDAAVAWHSIKVWCVLRAAMRWEGSKGKAF